MTTWPPVLESNILAIFFNLALMDLERLGWKRRCFMIQFTANLGLCAMYCLITGLSGLAQAASSTTTHLHVLQPIVFTGSSYKLNSLLLIHFKPILRHVFTDYFCRVLRLRCWRVSHCKSCYIFACGTECRFFTWQNFILSNSNHDVSIE